MKHYYISNPNNKKGFVEVTEVEFIAIVGTEAIRPYATRVYRGELSISDVPSEYQSAVQDVVDTRIARMGEYKNQKITSNELQSMIEEVL